MANHDINIIAENLDSLHKKILDSKFAEQVTESEVLSLYLAVAKINNQAVEIEKLKAECQAHRNTVIENEKRFLEFDVEQVAEINRLESELKTAKSEARKEFVERYKKEIIKRYEDIAYRDLFFNVLDKLLDEMETENK